MKKIVILFILSLFIICPIFNVGGIFVSADGKPAENYVVYDEKAPSSWVTALSLPISTNTKSSELTITRVMQNW